MLIVKKNVEPLDFLTKGLNQLLNHVILDALVGLVS